MSANNNTPSDNTLLPTRLNAAPSIFRGCSLSELMTLAGLGVLLWIPFWLLICGLLGFLMMGVGIGLLTTILWVVISASFLQKIKRGRPIGYFSLKIHLLLNEWGVVKSTFIRDSRVWDIGRRL